MFDITLELINGLKVGIEHMVLDEEGVGYEQPDWLIIIDLLVLRLGIVKYSYKN